MNTRILLQSSTRIARREKTLASPKIPRTPMVHALYLIGIMMLSGCAGPHFVADESPLKNAGLLPMAQSITPIQGLSHCTSKNVTQLKINPDEPMIVIVHGCFSSAGRFRALADVFAFHGQQTLCFNYNDRDSISASASQLNEALTQLSNVMTSPQLTVIGHSQGGLVARHGVSDSLRHSDIFTQNTLVTISGPFGGISAATHCGWNWLHIASLGLSTAICQIVTGSKWIEIPPDSHFIQHPAELHSSVATHLKINTNEINTCRRFDAQAKCIEDDFVFSLKEQHSTIIASNQSVIEMNVNAGHVEIVGDAQVKPDKLIQILQEQRIMKPTPIDKKLALNELLNTLYIE